jgi:hypothetical protein
MARQDIPKALAPFQRIEGALARKHQGTGLGLPLTMSLVEMHGGSMHLQSEIDVGTTVTVTVRFPVARVVVENSKDQIATGMAAASLLPATTKSRHDTGLREPVGGPPDACTGLKSKKGNLTAGSARRSFPEPPFSLRSRSCGGRPPARCGGGR